MGGGDSQSSQPRDDRHPRARCPRGGRLMKTHIAVNGACGRMGQRLVALSQEDPDLALTAAVDWAKHPHQGRDAGELAGVGSLGVPVRGELPIDARVDVLIDFSTPEGTMSILPVCVARKTPI